MKKPSHVIEIFLQPGEWYFGERDTRIRTVLGSCVSLTAWHPRLKIGGMCHYMLPSRGATVPALDGRYADEALTLLLREIRAVGTRPEEFQFKMFGGGNMFPGQSCLKGKANVSSRNVAAARELAMRHGLRVSAEHLGGTGHRHVMFDIWSGYAWVRHHAGEPVHQCEKCETRVECEAI